MKTKIQTLKNNLLDLTLDYLKNHRNRNNAVQHQALQEINILSKALKELER